MSALDGLKVVEFANGLAGSVAGVLLADYGADVVKVSETAIPKTGSAAFRYRNKSSLMVDLDSAADQELLAAYLRGADVIILGDQWASRSLPDALVGAMDANTAAILTRMPTAWPGRPVWETDVESHGLLCAYAAISARQMSTDGSPVEMIGPYILYIQGIWAAAAVLSAVYAQSEGEAGQKLSISGIQAAMITSSASIAVDPNGPETSTKVGPYGKHPAYRPFLAKCGNWVASGALGVRFVELFLKTLGLGWIIDAPRVGGNPDAVTFPENFDWSTEIIEEAFLKDTAENWEVKFRAQGIPVELIKTRDTVMDEEQVTANGIDWRLAADGWGDMVTPATPAILTRTPPSLRKVAINDDRRNGPVWPRKPAATREVKMVPGPLHGVRILNLGTFVATPKAGFLLSELGADVIKVEDLKGDPFRATGYSFNRGMRSLSVSLRSEEGQELFRELSKTADVAINGMRPGKMGSLGLDHARLEQINPRIISISLSAYGAKGPKAMFPGVDMVVQSLTGIMAAQGTPDAPYVSSAAYVDVTSACVSAYATALALVERKRSGRGQAIEEALLRTATFMQAGDVTSVDGAAELAQGYTDYKGPADHDRLHEARDGWVRILAPDEASALAALGTANGVSIGDVIAKMGLAEVVERMAAAGLAATRVRKLKEILRDPAFMQSGQIVLSQGEVHAMPLVGRLAGFSGGQKGEMLLPPGIGEHTEAVLAEGKIAADRLKDLIDRGVVRTGKPMPKRFGLTYR